MKLFKMLQFSALLFSILIVGIFCEAEESDTFKQKKLKLRQEIDKTILDIDQELVVLHEHLEKEIEDRKPLIKNKIQELQAAREKLESTKENLDDVSESEWKSFKEKVQSDLNNISVKLQDIKMKRLKDVPPKQPVYP